MADMILLFLQFLLDEADVVVDVNGFNNDGNISLNSNVGDVVNIISEMDETWKIWLQQRFVNFTCRSQMAEWELAVSVILLHCNMF